MKLQLAPSRKKIRVPSWILELSKPAEQAVNGRLRINLCQQAKPLIECDFDIKVRIGPGKRALELESGGLECGQKREARPEQGHPY